MTTHQLLSEVVSEPSLFVALRLANEAQFEVDNRVETLRSVVRANSIALEWLKKYRHHHNADFENICAQATTSGERNCQPTGSLGKRPDSNSAAREFGDSKPCGFSSSLKHRLDRWWHLR